MQRITAGEKISYTGGLLGQNMIYSFVSLYIMFFFTDLLRIPPQSVTVIVVIASLWDAVNDPIMGFIADRTSTKMGKFRPYLLIGPAIIAVTTTLCFVSFGGSPLATALLAAICYVLWDMSYTVCDIPIWAISSVVSREPGEKNTMVTLGKIGGTVGTVIVSVASVALLNVFGGERVPGAFTAAAAVIAVLGAVLMALSGVFVKERIHHPKADIPMRDNMRTILGNKPLLALLMTLLIINTVNNIRQVTQIYFAVYVWGSVDYVTYIGLSLVIGMIFGMAISPRLLVRFEKKHIFMAACGVGAVSSAVPFVFSMGVLPSLILLGVSFAATGVTTISSTAMLMDGIDLSEHRLGFRGEGIVFSMNTFLNKLSATLAKGILGLVMVGMHYVDNMPPNPTVIAGFSALVYLVPVASFLLAVVPLFFYRVDEQQLAQIRHELAARNEMSGAADAL